LSNILVAASRSVLRQNIRIVLSGTNEDVPAVVVRVAVVVLGGGGGAGAATSALDGAEGLEVPNAVEHAVRRHDPHLGV
jgi:hypothetical protein